MLLFLNKPTQRWTAQRLVFLFPILCFLAAFWFMAESLWFQITATRTQGEVVKVYVWDDNSFFNKSGKVYGPVFRYTWTDGKPTQASTGQSFFRPFKEGERHTILYNAQSKENVRLTLFEQLWALPVILFAIAFATFLLAWLIWFFIIRPRIARPGERRLLSLPSGSA